MQPVFQCSPVSLPSHCAPSIIPHPSITHVRFLVSLQRLPGIWSDRCAGAKRTHESQHHLPSIHRLKYRKHLSISISAVSKKVQPFVMDHSAHSRTCTACLGSNTNITSNEQPIATAWIRISGYISFCWRNRWQARPKCSSWTNSSQWCYPNTGSRDGHVNRTDASANLLSWSGTYHHEWHRFLHSNGPVSRRNLARLWPDT